MSKPHLLPPTAMSLAERYKGELRAKLIALGNPVTFRDWFVASYWEELDNNELSELKIQAAIDFLISGK